MLLAQKDWPNTWYVVYSTVTRVESAEERQERLARRLVFNGATWPTTIPCTVTGDDDVTVSDTSKLFSHTSLQESTATVYTCKLQCYSYEAECTCRCVHDVIKRIVKCMASLTFYRLHIAKSTLLCTLDIAKMKYSLNITPFCSQLIPGICM